MDLTALAYLIYLAVTVPLVVYVASTLSRNGAIFLRTVFHGNDELAASVNQLLFVGFYLLNLGYVALFLRSNETVTNARGVVELVSVKVGYVAIVLGIVHLLNVYVFNRMRRNAIDDQRPFAPVIADDYTSVVR